MKTYIAYNYVTLSYEQHHTKPLLLYHSTRDEIFFIIIHYNIAYTTDSRWEEVAVSNYYHCSIYTMHLICSATWYKMMKQTNQSLDHKEESEYKTLLYSITLDIQTKVKPL